MLRARVVVPPDPIIGWDEIKAHLRAVEDDRSLVEGYVAAATSWLDGQDGWLARSLGQQTLEVLPCSFDGIRLPYGPIIGIESVVYIGVDGEERTVPAESYHLFTDGTFCISRPLPPVANLPDPIRIRYLAGYADEVVPSDDEQDEPAVRRTVPKAIIQAIYLIVGHWYANREAVVIGGTANEMPLAAEALLASYRKFR